MDRRQINICLEIGKESKRFGLIPLDDPTGKTVDNVIGNEQHFADNNRALLQHWLETGRRSWVDLMYVLKKCSLITLARDIDDSIRAGIKTRK